MYALCGRAVSDCACCPPQGVFVLVDNSFGWVRFFSAPEGQDTKAAALKHLAFPCGMVRGALASFGIDSMVSVEVTALPQCGPPPTVLVCVCLVDSVCVCVCVCTCVQARLR